MTPEQEAALAAWKVAYDLAQEASPLFDREMLLRKEVFSEFFPTPTEGTNTFTLENGWKLKAQYKLDRKIDVAVLSTVQEQLRKIGVNPDPLVKYEPKVELSAYRELTAEQLAVFDQALIIKPSSPQVTLVEPKEKK